MAVYDRVLHSKHPEEGILFETSVPLALRSRFGVYDFGNAQVNAGVTCRAWVNSRVLDETVLVKDTAPASKCLRVQVQVRESPHQCAFSGFV